MRIRLQNKNNLHLKLDNLVQSFHAENRIADDPVSIVHEYTHPADQELAALIASSLAFGNIVAVKRSVRRVLSVLRARPSTYLATLSQQSLRKDLRGFVHRVYRDTDVVQLLLNARHAILKHGSLGKTFEAQFACTNGNLRHALALFADELRGPSPSRSMGHLMPDPRAGSACKRLLLYLRWMIRPRDGIDLGLWNVPTSALIIPLDTHAHRISVNLGLTESRVASWKTAEQITARLREFDAADPVKYDFAMCHFGVSRQCPSRRKTRICNTCILKTACRHWYPS